jgi:tRNA dimethylallyltransferase
MLMRETRPILIAGPTASGKSALALALAERLGGWVINADSMQVYAELSVLTARPTGDDLQRAPHRLYGHVPASQAYSVGLWLRSIAVVLDGARDAGALPIIVGGTGLYFEALTKGLSPVPEIAEFVRGHWRSEADRLGPERLHAVLAARDPAMAERLRASDPQRVTRALEVLDGTGRSLGDWQRETGRPILTGPDVLRFLVQPDRAQLRERCERRFDAMLQQGAIDEVRALSALSLDAALPAMRALGVRPLLAYLRGQLTLPEAAEQAKAETRQYAKRQMTWIRSRMPGWHHLTGGAEEALRLAAGTAR